MTTAIGIITYLLDPKFIGKIIEKDIILALIDKCVNNREKIVLLADWQQHSDL